ncbi:MAG: LytR C-terminal domain-containing protein [Acidimicrobiales bacterium]
MALSVLGGAVLTYVGVDTLRNSRAGRTVSGATDPSAPGFEAFVEPTPTLLLLHFSEGRMSSAALLTLNGGDAGGAVVLVPPSTRTGDAPDAYTLATTAAFLTDPSDVAGAAQPMLGLGISEVVAIDDARWAELVEPVAPLVIDNPDELASFPAGPILLEADQVAAWLNPQVEGEDDLVRLFRHQLFWEAWAAAIAASPGGAAVPGEVDVGLGRFARGLGAGPVAVTTMPVVQSEGPDGATRLEPDRTAIDDLVSSVVPFPTAARPGGRIRVRLLDGTGDADHVVRVAPLVVPAGSQIVVAGNADRFDHDRTEIRFHAPDGRDAAERLRAALGTGEVVDDVRPVDAFDVTIVLGDDL